jgi:hypothetical protein
MEPEHRSKEVPPSLANLYAYPILVFLVTRYKKSGVGEKGNP